MKITYEIKLDAVLDAVKLETFISGESTKGKEEILSTKSQANNDNDDILSFYLNTAQSRIIDLLSGLLIETDSLENTIPGNPLSEKFIYVLNVPDNFDYNQGVGIVQGIKDFMVNFVLEKWFRATWPEKARLYQDLSEYNIALIKHRLNQRTQPVRRCARPLGF